MLGTVYGWAAAAREVATRTPHRGADSGKRREALRASAPSLYLELQQRNAWDLRLYRKALSRACSELDGRPVPSLCAQRWDDT